MTYQPRIGDPYRIGARQTPSGPRYSVDEVEHDPYVDGPLVFRERTIVHCRTRFRPTAERICKQLNDAAHQWAEEHEPHGL